MLLQTDRKARIGICFGKFCLEFVTDGSYNSVSVLKAPSFAIFVDALIAQYHCPFGTELLI